MFKIQPWNIAKDGKISQPGAYAITIEEHHSDCCVGPSVSSGNLRTIDGKSPAHYWAHSYLNPKARPRPSNDAFDFGAAAHHLLLGEDNFGGKFAVRPAEFDSWRTKASQEWRAVAEAAGKVVITSDDIEKIRDMADALASNPVVQAGIINGVIEISIVWQDASTGVWLKARPDALPVTLDLVGDYKTAADASPAACTKAISEHGYHMQLALAGMGLKALGVEISDESYALLFQEKSYPHVVTPVEVDAEAISFGRRQIRRALDTFARCFESGEWPGYVDGIAKCGLSPWMRSKLNDQAASGLLPNEDAGEAPSPV